MTTPRTDPIGVRPLAAALLRDALTAAEHGKVPEAVGALMSIDAESWRGIEQRLYLLGSSIPALLKPTAEGAAP